MAIRKNTLPPPRDDEQTHNSLCQIAYMYIKRLILSGELKGGDKISEKEIAQRLEVSRTPIREALKQLEQYGVVEFKPRSYAKVVSITSQDAIDLAMVRIEIEKLAARTILANPELLDAGALLEKVDLSLRAVDGGNMPEAYLNDSAFHLELARQSGNPILCDALARLDSKSQLVRVHSRANPEAYGRQLEEHRRIVERLSAGDAPGAMKVIATHITPRFWESKGLE